MQRSVGRQVSRRCKHVAHERVNCIGRENGDGAICLRERSVARFNEKVGRVRGRKEAPRRWNAAERGRAFSGANRAARKKVLKRSPGVGGSRWRADTTRSVLMATTADPGRKSRLMKHGPRVW